MCDSSNRRLRRFGPVSLAGALCAGAFAAGAYLAQQHYGVVEQARVLLVGGVFVGAAVGISLGLLRETGCLRKRQLSVILTSIVVGFAAVGAVFHGVHLYRDLRLMQVSQASNRKTALVERAGGSRPCNSTMMKFSGPAIHDSNLDSVRTLDDTTWLELHGTSVKGPGLQNLSPWQSLTHLHLSNNPIGDAGLEHLQGLQSLETLELDRTHVSDDGLRHLQALPNLKVLTLVDTEITDAGLENLKGLKSLINLDLERTNVTKTGVQDLKVALPRCYIMWTPSRSGDEAEAMIDTE